MILKTLIFDNVYVEGDVKVRDSHITGKSKGSAHRDET